MRFQCLERMLFIHTAMCRQDRAIIWICAFRQLSIKDRRLHVDRATSKEIYVFDVGENIPWSDVADGQL